MSQAIRRKHLKNAFASRLIPGHVLEFGVGNGRSATWLSALTKQTVFGFDSFQGLPIAWRMGPDKIYMKGSFKCDEPTIEGVEMWVGEFDQTIPRWKEQYPGGISFIHIDSDLYRSCRTVLLQLNDRIVPGTVLLFDQYYNNENADYIYWRQGEYRACYEWCEQYNREIYELSRSEKGAAAFRVIQ